MLMLVPPSGLQRKVRKTKSTSVWPGHLKERLCQMASKAAARRSPIHVDLIQQILAPNSTQKRKHHCACAPPRQARREDRRAPRHLNSRPLICASSCQADLTTRSAQCQVGHCIDGRSIGELPKHKSHSYTQLDLTLVESSRKGPICRQTQRPTRAGHEAQVSIPEPAPHDKSDGVLKFQGGTFLKTFSAG